MRGFSLLEILVTVAVFFILFGCIFLTGSGVARRLTDPYSDENIAREVAQAAAWLDDLIYRAAMAEKDFEIIVSPSTPSSIFVKWEANDIDEWTSKRIGMKVYSDKTPKPVIFRYDWREQTMTPALTLRVFTQKDHYMTAAKWFIIISGHGLVRTSQRMP